jgi:hypothetical protein
MADGTYVFMSKIKVWKFGWYIFIPKIKILEGLGIKLLEYFMAIWNIFSYIYLTYNFVVYIVVIWYIFPILVY